MRWQVVKTPTIISNDPVYYICIRCSTDWLCKANHVHEHMYRNCPTCSFFEIQNRSTLLQAYFQKVPVICTKPFSTRLTNLTPLLPQSRDCSCYVSRPILRLQPLWMQKRTGLCALADLWHQPLFANVTYAWSRRIHGITPAIGIMGWNTAAAPTAGHDADRRAYTGLK